MVTAPDRATFTVTAAPLEPGQTGTRYFFIDQTGVIRVSTNGPATADSEPVHRR
jgi:hypothetical protein